jgi:mono/diheme cytochrome c family protein
MRTRSVIFLVAAVWVTVSVWGRPAVSTVRAQARPQVPAAPVEVAGAASGAQSLRPMLDRYCVTCHNSRLNTAGLALDAVNLADVGPHAEVLEKVVKKLRGRMMPPQGALQPDAETRQSLLRGLEAALDRSAELHQNPGRTLLHRFNRAEYANAIRDLLSLDVDATTLLPPDDSSFGFDNMADILGISPLLMERYISAAEKISALAVGDPGQPRTAALYRVKHDLPQGEHVEGLPMGTRGGTLVRHTFPLDGEYVIKVKLWRTSVGFTRGLQREHDLEVSVDGEPVLLAQVGGRNDYETSVLNAAAIDAQLDTRLRTRIRVTAGPHDVAATFLAIAGGVLTGPESLSPTMFAVDPLYIHGVPGIESVTIEGPFNPTVPRDTPSRRAIFTCRPPDGATMNAAEISCARTIISRLARRAYRRPVTGADVEPLLTMYRSGRTGAGFDQGIQVAIQGLLTSPNFLFRTAQDPAGLAPGTVYRISDLELASRLSFFLWSSIPDDELLDVASRGTLTQAAVLERQVRRMLKDQRASALVTNFGGQWLHLRNLAAFVPDRTDFPEFDDLLRQAMRRETELFLDSVLREDRSALDLLRADYTFVNERLARHYGIAGIYGSQFRRITLADPVRHGLLGQASILAVTSYPNRTSPVVRGRWILENVLGVPPPPPPPNVAASLPDEAKPKTMRERMEVHRQNPSCAACHRVMDPLGFALENFDAVGAWRTRDLDNAIDPSGTLADGTAVDGPVALRRALLATPQQFVGTVAEKLLTYSLGRGLTAADMPAVRRIVTAAAPGDYKMGDLVLGVVRSVPFQMRVTPATTTRIAE